VEQEYEELNAAIRLFQNTMMRVRYSSIPVVVAPHGGISLQDEHHRRRCLTRN